jgi:hypothetical protein
MSGPKRNPDKLNTIGIVVVGICGAVLVYVSITALQAFYMNNTSVIQTTADYGGQDQPARGKKADELRNIGEAAANAGAAGTYRMKIEDAMKLVVEDAKTDPSHLTGSKLPPSTKESIPPRFGRPAMGGAAPPATPPVDGASTEAPTGAGSAAPPAGASSAAAPAAAPNPGAAGSAAPATPTGAGPRGAGASPEPPAGSGGATR